MTQVSAKLAVRCTLALTAVLGLVACTAILGDFTTDGAGSSGDASPQTDAPEGDGAPANGTFTFTSAPVNVFVQAGKTAQIAITVQRNNFDGAIAITATGLPAGVTAAPLSIAAGAPNGTLVLTAAASAATGAHTTASIAGAGGTVTAPAQTVDVTVSGPTGTVDTTFPAALPFAAGLGTIDSALLQSDGKIVLLGTFHSVAGDAPALAIRINADGTLDASFHSAIATNASASPIGTALKGILQPDGKILVAWTEGASSNLNITRLLPTGALDTAWHDPTKATVSTGSAFASRTGPNIIPLTLASDGSVLYAEPGGSGIQVWRWTSGGVADTTLGTFGDYGHTTLDKAPPVLSVSDVGSVLALPGGGAFFLGDGAINPGFSECYYTRTNAAFVPDPSFGPNAPDGGWAGTNRYYTPVFESLILGSDLFTATGNSSPCASSQVAFCLTHSTVVSDVTGSEHICPDQTSGLGCADFGIRLVLGPSKTIYVAGFSGTAGGIPVIARYATGPLTVDTTYGTSGVAKLRASAATQALETPVAVLVTPEGLAYAFTQDAQYPIQRAWP